MKLQGMKSVVIGGGSGIGGAIGLAYAKEGADVAFLDINLEGAEEYANQAKEYGISNFAATIDVTNKASIQQAFLEIEKKFGSLDTVVYSAGVSYILPFLECPEETWDVTMDINLKGMFLCLQTAVPMLLKKNNSSIICLSSQSGKVGASQYQAYCASKFGVIGMVQSLALEFASSGLRVNSICPGVIHTPMWDKQVETYAKKRDLKSEEVFPYFKSKIPLARLGTVDDVSNLAVFLASDDSTYITGQALNVSGGQVMF